MPAAGEGTTVSVRVRLHDGIEIETQTLGTIRCDASDPTGDWNIVSHAHTDHLPRLVGDAPIACSPVTAALAETRRDLLIDPAVPEEIELLDSGHIDGSRAALIRDGDRRILYTGDVAVRDRYGLEGFAPPSADVLVVEATYGDPSYSFPTIASIEGEVEAWMTAHAGRPVICFAYALGKAQRVLRLLDRLGVDRVFASTGIVELNRVIARATGQALETRVVDSELDLDPADVVVVPGSLRQAEWVEDLVSEQEAVTAGFSGWAINAGYVYGRGLDRGFPLSDHCDFSELVGLVETVDPEMTYIHHGFADALAKALTRRGYRARALQRDQATLDAF